MSAARDRVVEVLTAEYERLKAETGEVLDLLDLLDARPVTAEDILWPSKPKGKPSLYTRGGTRGMSTDDVRIHSRKVILAAMREHGACNGGLPVTSQQLEEWTGISRTTVSRHMRHLIGEGRIERELAARPGPHGGRQPYLYRVLPAVEEREHHIDSRSGLVVD